MNELSFLNLLAYVMIISAAATFFTLASGIKAFYGRYSIRGGLSIPVTPAWVIQECPSFLFSAYYWWNYCNTLPETILVGLFVAHYINRTFIYPFKLNSKNGSPWYIVLSAVVFCTWNGYMQAAYHSQYHNYDDFFSSLSTYVGFALFCSGMFINITSDNTLCSLRKPGETKYYIPRGGMFEYVTGANFFGEITEWTGFAIMAGSLPAVAFAIFTAANIGPRALQHHQWYKEKFGKEYPSSRKALIPFVL